MDGEIGHEATSTSRGKGKEKDVPPSPSSSAPTPNDGKSSQPQREHMDGIASDASFAERMVTSASRLSRAAFTSQPEGLHSGASGKAPSGPSSAPDLAHRGETATYRGHKGFATGAGPAFAPGRHASAAGELQYGHFMDAHAEPSSLSQLHTSDAAQPGPGPGLTEQNALTNARFSGAQSALQQQESRDGQPVIDLLNSPGELDDLDEIDDGSQPYLSPGEESALRKALFGVDEKNSLRNWAMLLDFQPDFLQDGNVAQLQQHFGDVAPQQARALWMDSWNDVLTSYTDEVWGDLGSLAREAQREVDEARGHGPGEQGQGIATDVDPSGMKALRRLRQILAHVRETH